jgi:hypothetical protein
LKERFGTRLAQLTNQPLATRTPEAHGCLTGPLEFVRPLPITNGNYC